MPVELSTLALFAPACFAMNLTIGPNNLLAMNNGARHGPRRASAAVLGRLAGQAILISISAAGLATLLLSSVVAFQAIKLFGACWLLYLAWRLWRDVPAEPGDGARAPSATAPPSVRALARDEFLVAIANPKAMLIFTAFLPQFVDPARPVAAQFAVVGAIFLALEWVAAAGYATLGARLARWLRTARNRVRFQRCNAALLAGAAIGLLALRREGQS